MIERKQEKGTTITDQKQQTHIRHKWKNLNKLTLSICYRVNVVFISVDSVGIFILLVESEVINNVQRQCQWILVWSNVNAHAHVRARRYDSLLYYWKCEHVKGFIYHVFIYLIVFFFAPRVTMSIFTCGRHTHTHTTSTWKFIVCILSTIRISTYRNGAVDFCCRNIRNVLTQRTGEWIKCRKFKCHSLHWMVHLGSIKSLQIIEWKWFAWPSKIWKRNDVG